MLPGDGIGPEVVAAAREVVAASGASVRWDEQPIGSSAPGGPLPEAALASVRRHGVALKGPVATGTAGAPSANVGLRRALDLYVQLRPCRSLPAPADRLPGAGGSAGLDVVVARETTEDLYRGIGVAAGSAEAAELARWVVAHGLDDGLPEAVAFSLKPTSAAAVRRAAARTMEWMRAHGRERLTVVHKATVMRPTDGLFLEVVDELGATSTDIEVDRMQVDAACAALIRDPGRFDVLFMPNMYGDIVSDVAAALAGGVGMAPGVNLGDDAAVFEAVHGTAPSHVGRGDVNPIAMVRSAAMLLAHVGEVEASRRIEAAVADVVREGRSLTYDLVGRGPAVGTADVTAALVRRLSG